MKKRRREWRNLIRDENETLEPELCSLLLFEQASIGKSYFDAYYLQDTQAGYVGFADIN